MRLGGGPSPSAERARTLRSKAASAVLPPAIAGRCRPRGVVATAGALGCHTRRNMTSAPAEPSEATMSVSSIEM